MSRTITAYYNENDQKTAAWLRELILRGLITHGHVDERSIEDVIPSDIKGFHRAHFFAGIGGWDYALKLANWRDYDDRQLFTGSCPCQPFSAAGKRGGFADERHLWPAWFHLIDQCKPAIIFGEQVASALAWLDLVQTDLEASGYAFAAADICAAGVGAPHIRQRAWWVAYSNGIKTQRTADTWDKLHPWATEPSVARVANGIPRKLVDMCRIGYGNSLVPQVAAAFIKACS